ncbi:hypothetical protein [Methylobacterium sp. JK268]
MRLSAVAAPDVPGVWPRVRPWLAAACARPGCDLAPADLLSAILARRALLVLIGPAEGEPVAAGVSQVREAPDGGRTAWVLAVGGAGARAWRHTLALLEDGARAKGCARLEFVGRPGWRRLLPDYTAAPCEAGTHYSKDLL